MSGWLWLALALALPLAAFAVVAARVASFQRWYARTTRGLGYYGRTVTEREAYKAEVRARGAFVRRVAALRARVAAPKRLPGIVYRGVHGPPQCSVADFARTASYRPRKSDVFVATQMKCGTTWMQQIVYEVLLRGHGDLGDAGHRSLYAASPWIESPQTVPMDDAPRIGERGSRVIKTHMPVDLCPFGAEARYVYVTRDPVACFASCADFVGQLAGAVAPPRAALLDWFLSDRMWWRPWPDHVDGWWRRAQDHRNVLFVHYEELLADLPAQVERVAAFLETPLSAQERATVVEKSGFAYMKTHGERFEMSPPTAFSTDTEFFKSGKRERGAESPAAERERIAGFCRERLRGAAYPFARFYPELAGRRGGLQ